jgi:hypothetical protein
MRKTLLSLALPVLVAGGGAATALAQGMPTTQPKFLHIIREQVEVGRSADHSKWEAGWPAAFEKAKFPYTYIALEAVTGPSEVWYVEPFASEAAFGESLAKQNADPVLSAETERLSRGDAEFVSELNAMQAVGRPDLSYGAFPDLAMMRFWEIGTFQVKPGHGQEFEAALKAWAVAAARSAPDANWRTYEVVAGAPDGTYLFFSTFAAFGDLEKERGGFTATRKGFTSEERSAVDKLDADGTVTSWSNRFRLDPRQSYVPPEIRQEDPAFWMPKATPKATPPAKKNP